MKSKEVIAVDMDDVVVETAQNIIDYVNNGFDTNMTINDFYTRDPALWGVDSIEEAIERVNSYLSTDEYFSKQPVQEAIHALRRLDEEYNLFIVTGRPDFTELATRRWLQEFFPDLFKDVVFTNFYDSTKIRHKGDVCREIGATILIDDHPEHCESALQNGVRPYLFGDYPWNQIDQLSDGIQRVPHWPIVEKLLLPGDV